MEKRAYLDFETANSKGTACQIGIATETLEYESMLSVPDDLWHPFNIGFMFRGTQFAEYKATRDNLPSINSVIVDHSDIWSDHVIYAWNAPTERKVLGNLGIEVQVTCLLQYARSLYGKREAGFYKLGNFAKMLGLNVETDSLHGAGYDAKLTMEVDNELRRIHG